MTTWTVLKSGIKKLQLAGVENPLWETRVIAAHVLGIQTTDTFDQLSFSAQKEESFFSLVNRRCSGEPLQYVIGCWDFYGREFLLSPSVLIPRPETEQLIDIVLEQTLPDSPSILDVGTGSGAVGITLALEIPDSNVTGTDISSEAVKQAQENAMLLHAKNFTAVTDDLASGQPGPFHVITANLPYVPSGELPGLQGEVRDHEPHLALDGGDNGTSLILRMVEQSLGLTVSGSFLILETDCTHEESVPAFFQRHYWKRVGTHRDLAGRHRFVSAVRR